MLAKPDPVIDNPKAKGRYFTKYSLTATVAELKTNPEPKPEQEHQIRIRQVRHKTRIKKHPLNFSSNIRSVFEYVKLVVHLSSHPVNNKKPRHRFQASQFYRIFVMRRSSVFPKLRHFTCYRPERGCEGYVFTPVCLSTGGVCFSACWDTTPPPQTRTPRDQVPPQDKAPPRTRQPQRTRHPPGSRRLLLRTVRILL